MADFLPEEIVCNIFAASSKTRATFLVRIETLIGMLREPRFMNSRSRKTIILPLKETLHLIDDNVPSDDTCNLVVSRCYPLKNLLRKHVDASVIGTFMGIVLLGYSDYFILYNPFTCESKKLPNPPPCCNKGGYGFGYGENSDDLKIVRFSEHCNICDVYNFKESSWSSWSTSRYNISIKHAPDVGTFINGFLYWIANVKNTLTVLNVKSNGLSKMNLPFDPHLLGTLNGYLCALHRGSDTNAEFNMWVMKEQNQWSKIYSFKFPLNDTPKVPSYALRILDSGRILMMSLSWSLLIIYDPSEDSYNTLNISLKDGDLGSTPALEFLESLVSPLDICSRGFDKRKN
ncbi:putative F-box protein At3g16210 [Bidens hawaiensis]|uniref:putative F-box protein At3g16210 n=1 Tax=Bidens hawaiensis TaxID=980011 RepID=UPI00404B86EE